MDKNMINIDDLFRQRLSGGEDKERPGAWLQMRELLDKEMPVVAPGNTTNWRRMFGYAAGLVLLASATIGGYTAYNSLRNVESSGAVAVNTTSTGGYDGVSAPAVLTKASEQKRGDVQTIAAGEASKPAESMTSGKGITGNASAVKTVGSTYKTANTTGTTTKHNIPGKPASSKVLVAIPKTTTNDNKPTADSKDISVDTKFNIKKETAATSAGASNVAKNNAPAQPVAGTATGTTAKNSVPVQEKVFASAGSTTIDNKKQAANQLQNKPAASATPSANATSKNDIAKNDNVKKSMIDKVEERETYDRKTGVWKKDTIGKGKVEWKEQQDPIVAKADNNTADNTLNNATVAVVPNAAVEVKSENDAEKLVSLSDFRTSSKKSNYETRNIFEEMVKNAKLQLGGVRFYPGLIVGINTALSGKNSMTGFQVGVTGNLSLNEKWGIVSELKYMQRFKNGNRESNRNDYITNTQSINNGQSYQWDSVVSYFTYPTVSSVELPVMVKYSFNRFNMLGGANLAYYMGFSPNHVEQPYRMTGAKPPIVPAEGGAIMTSADFGSRFGVGYLLGVGYQISPAVQLDMRMSQSVWDNAAGAGATRVSKEVFQLPSLQFNMSYRFSSNKYKPYRAH